MISAIKTWLITTLHFTPSLNFFPPFIYANKMGAFPGLSFHDTEEMDRKQEFMCKILLPFIIMSSTCEWEKAQMRGHETSQSIFIFLREEQARKVGKHTSFSFCLVLYVALH
jgi:hypothetical protein